MSPTLRLYDLPVSGSRVFRQLVRGFWWASGVLLLASICILLFTGRSDMARSRFLNAAFPPLLLGVVVLALAFVLPLDVRIAAADVFTLPAALLIVLLTTTWVVLAVREVRHERR